MNSTELNGTRHFHAIAAPFRAPATAVKSDAYPGDLALTGNMVGQADGNLTKMNEHRSSPGVSGRERRSVAPATRSRRA